MFGDFLSQFKIPGIPDAVAPAPQMPAGAPAALPAAQPTDQVGIASPQAPAAGITPPTPQPGAGAASLAIPSPLGAEKPWYERNPPRSPQGMWDSFQDIIKGPNNR